jgi:hypothetical protein
MTLKGKERKENDCEDSQKMFMLILKKEVINCG